ncbi:cytochrome b/b6 domain-containing protein [Thermoproteota archaeon]
MSSQEVKRHDIFQRAFHWVNFGALLLLLWTGLTIYDLNILGIQPFSAFAILLIGDVFAPLIFEIHKYAAFALLGGFIFHVLYDTGLRGVFWSEIPSKADLRGMNIMAKNFLGISKEYVKFHKYNPGQKMVHIIIAIVVVLIGMTGFIMSANYRFLVPIWWLPLNFDFVLYWSRIAHDVLTFVLITLTALHFYFGARKENWPSFISMFSGVVPKEYQENHFSATKEPEIIPAPKEEK